MIKKWLTIIGKGAFKTVDEAVTGGFVGNIIEETEKYPRGKVDWIRFVKVFLKFSVPVLLCIAFIKGWITSEDVAAFNKIF